MIVPKYYIEILNCMHALHVLHSYIASCAIIIIIINFVNDRVIQKAGPVNILPYTQTYSIYNYNNNITKQTTLTNYNTKIK